MASQSAATADSWRVTYPSDCVKYIEPFRREYWDHGGVCRLLDDFFKTQGDVRTVCELGSGGGTNLAHLAEHGYRCFGYDANEESVRMSRARAADRQESTEFELLDFASAVPDRSFDAVVSLFVPISLRDMRDLALKTHQIIRPGGYFACMLLAVEEPYHDVAERRTSTQEHLVIDGVDVVRMNFFEKSGDRIRFEGVYLANEPAGVRMFKDVDTYDLVSARQTLELPDDKFELLARERIYGKADQAPPMTYEIVEIYRRR